MRLHRWVVVAVTTGMVLGLMATAAMGSRFGILDAEAGFRIEWATVTFESAGNSINCHLTLEGSFTSASFRKTTGTRIGSVTRAGLSTCSGGSATILSETLPWSMTYASFTGTLPTITRILTDLVGVAIRVQPTGSVACLMRSEASHPVRGVAEIIEGELIWYRLESGFGIPLTESFLCEFAGQGHMTGTGVAHTREGEHLHSLVVLI